MMYDLIVIGAGWAGFNAALRAKELGLKVCLIEPDKIGGTCLNRGCIPTKSLIASAKTYSLVKKAINFGIESDNPRINFLKIQERKNRIINELAQGMSSKLSGIEFINSSAQIISPNIVQVSGARLETKFILIATGSSVLELETLKFDGLKIVSSDQILELREIPQSLLIVGGGVIGCEFASLFSLLGTQVTMVEKMPNLLSTEDQDISRKLEVIFKKKGIKVDTQVDLAAINLSEHERVLVCIGRRANLSNLGLESLGVNLLNQRIAINTYLQTNINNIYAAGDCASGLNLAHFAAYQGVTAVENMVSGNQESMNKPLVPACIFTDPEIASVGLTSQQAVNLGLAVKNYKFDFRASAMARIIDESEGFIKLVIDDNTQELLGASIIGPRATELISTLALAITAHFKVNQIRKMIFAHPTLSESLQQVLN